MENIDKSVSNLELEEKYSQKELDEINKFVQGFKLAEYNNPSSKKEDLLLYKFDQDERTCLIQKKIYKNIGQMIIRKKLGGHLGTCSLIQFELPQHILKEVERQEYNKTQKFFFLLTCAHNVDDSAYVDQELIGERGVAWKIYVIFGKQQTKDFNKEPLANKEFTLIMCINPANIFVHSKYKGNQASGYDIALIGIEKHDYKNIESYIKNNQNILDQNERQKAKFFFDENNLFQLIYDQNLNKKKKYHFGVCGYPGDPAEYRKQGYPQVQMFQEIMDLDRIEFRKDGKVILYNFIQTTEGQSGSPIIFCQDGVQQIIGVHTGFEFGYNLGTLIESLSYQSLKKQFCLLDKQELKKFDLFCKKQVKIKYEYMQEKMENQLNSKNSYSEYHTKVQNFNETLQEIYDEVQRKTNEFQKLPAFDNYFQKKNLIQKFRQGQTDTNLTDNVIEINFAGIKKSNLQIFVDFYRQNDFITCSIVDIFEDEMIEVKQIIQHQIDLQKLDFDVLQKQLLIRKEALQEIFDLEVQNICDNFQDEEDQMTTIFSKSQDMNMSKLDIIRKIIYKDPDLKQQMIDIFRQSFEDYKNLRKIFDQNKVGQYLFQNEIEEFLSFIQKNQHKKAINIVEKYYFSDPILVLKLFYYLSNNYDSLSDQTLKSMKIVTNKDYEIIKTYNNKNAIRVIQKAVLVTKDGKNDDNYEFQKKYEERQLFLNSDPDLVRNFLLEYNQFDKFNKSFLDYFEQLIEKYKNLNVNFYDYKYIDHYQLEQQGFQALIEKLKKDPNDNNITQEDLKQIARHFQRCIVVHKQDIKNYNTFGDAFQQKQHIHIQYDNINQIYQIVNSINLEIKHEVVNADQFEKQYSELFNQLQIWMRHFFGFKYLFQYIYNEKSGFYNKQHIEILEDLSKIFKKYEQDPSEENFKLTLLAAISLKNSGKEIFDEWYEFIQYNSNEGKIFKFKFDFFQARAESGILIQMLEQIKEYFPDPKILYKLEDFNRLSSRIDINNQIQRFKETKANPETFVQNIFFQIFSFIKSRKNISQLVSILKSIKLPVEVSSRFLLNLVLQNSDIDLRTRILHYQSEYFSLPLIMNCQTTFKSEKYILHYVPEVLFSMLEGMGIFNFAAGKRCIHPTGKSMLINDLLFPTQEFQHDAFEQQDKNLFSSGQVDVFFEKSFDVKRNFVIIDGQGLLKLKAIQSSLILTNIAMIHFHHKDLQEEQIVEDLKSKIQEIRQSQTDNIKITIILIIRDSSVTKVLKNFDDQQKLSNGYPFLSSIEDEIDQAIQLSNMSTMQKMERIEELKPMIQMFYSTIEYYNTDQQKYKFKFTKKNFSEKFIWQYKSQKSNAKLILDIIKKSNLFTQRVKQIQQNIFAIDALPVLDIKNKIRQQIIQLRNTNLSDDYMRQQIEEQMEKQLKHLKENLRQTKPSEIMEMFKQLVEDPNSSIIFQDIAKNLRELTFENIKEPKLKKEQLIKEDKDFSQNNIIQDKDEIDKRSKALQSKLDKLDDEIYQKSISLEYFWRCLVYYLEKDSEFKDWSQESSKKQIIDCIENQIKNGDCFELIDGENLEFKGLLIKEIFKVSKNDKVIVVCVIGPQSSGKSTLLNFAFGTQFFTSTGRCTKGIYFTLQKFTDDINNDFGVKWMIILDTEGLQSPERINDEYDRKIVLFAMLSSDVLIINNRGEINSGMINTLKVCCVSYDDLKQFENIPEIIYSNGQNSSNDKYHLKAQIECLKQEVIRAKAYESNTIQKTAEDLLGYNDDKLNIFGFAYKTEIIVKDLEKGIEQDFIFKINVTQFGVETSIINEVIFKALKKKKTFRDIAMWLEQSEQNWKLIDRYSSNIIQFQNLEQLKIDRKAMEFFDKQWQKYMHEQNVQANDKLKCYQQSLILLNTLNKHGEEKFNIEQEQFLLDNSKQKDLDLEKYVFNAYEKWKIKPEQKGIMFGTEKKYKSDIIQRNQLLKDQYTLMLNDKVQEQKIIMMDKNGFINVQIRAIEILRSNELKNVAQQDQTKYLENEFEKAFDQAIKGIESQDQLQKMKKNQFNSLVKQFGIYNPFILSIGDDQYNEIDSKINEEYSTQQHKDSRGIYNYLINEFIIMPDKGFNDYQFIRNLFQFDNEMIMRIPDDPKERIFDENKKEIFLELKSIFLCDYQYKVSQDLGNDLDRKQLYITILQKLFITKKEKKKVFKYNIYGERYIDWQYTDVNDEQVQKTILLELFGLLQQAGFIVSIQKNVYVEFSQLNLNDIFYEFGHSQQFSYDFWRNQSQKKQTWAEKISKYLKFDPSYYKYLDGNISFLFRSQPVEIKNRSTPSEDIYWHLSLDQRLKNALYISNPKITYKKSRKGKAFNESQFQAIVSPQKQEDSQLQKWSKLSQIAFRQLQWEKIIDHIILSVRKEMNLDKQSSSPDKNPQSKEVNLDEIFQLNQLTNNQIRKIESKYLGTELKEIINEELNLKMCLYISKDLDARISWCAILVCWVELYKKAETTFLKQLRYLESQKDDIRKDFFRIVQGKT